VGQVLARLDTSRLEAQAQQNEAALQAAQAKGGAGASERGGRAASTARAAQPGEGKLSGGKMPSQTDLDAAEGKPGAVQGR
jgi:HlyD family secretion protein